MAVSYDDVEERRLGREAKIANLAENKLENSFAEQERQLTAEEQMLGEKEDAAMTEDAMAFIDQMDKIDSQGGDPMQVLQQLPPAMQERVIELLNAEEDQQQPQQGQQFQPMPQQAAPQQQPVNITDTAKQIAQL